MHFPTEGAEGSSEIRSKKKKINKVMTDYLQSVLL